MSQTITMQTVIWTTTCYTCGIEFGMPRGYYQDRERDHRDFSCPNGHKQHFIEKTEAERERERRIRAEAQLARAEDRVALKERQRRAAVGQATKIKNRVRNGVCPFCKRSFADLKAHMESKHSDEDSHPH